MLKENNQVKGLGAGSSHRGKVSSHRLPTQQKEYKVPFQWSSLTCWVSLRLYATWQEAGLSAYSITYNAFLHKMLNVCPFKLLCLISSLQKIQEPEEQASNTKWRHQAAPKSGTFDEVNVLDCLSWCQKKKKKAEAKTTQCRTQFIWNVQKR